MQKHPLLHTVLERSCSWDVFSVLGTKRWAENGRRFSLREISCIYWRTAWFSAVECHLASFWIIIILLLLLWHIIVMWFSETSVTDGAQNDRTYVTPETVLMPKFHLNTRLCWKNLWADVLLLTYHFTWTSFFVR